MEGPTEVDIGGRFDERLGIEYLGKARLRDNGLYCVLANVSGALCLVEVRLDFTAAPDRSEKG